MRLNITYEPRVELGDLVSYIATCKGLSHREAENLVPGVYFEGCHLCDDDYPEGEGDWCKEVIKDMKRQGISAVEIWQDS